jgi:hypothetical protein
MGFMDKMKEQAAVVTAVAKDTAQKGQAKVEEVQAKRAADDVLRQLGLEVFLERTERGSDTTESAIASHVETLKEYEQEFGDLGDAAPESAEG